MKTGTNSRDDCYCSLWDTDPQALIRQGVPRGYCGFCAVEIKGKVCGKPGHVHQGDGPFTSCWCEDHEPGNGFNPIRLGCSLLFYLMIAWIIYMLIF
ncbi:MAG: hypothetical protein GY940_24490 [bacterium]|nr:hypothetical protein [bacterium]